MRAGSFLLFGFSVTGPSPGGGARPGGGGGADFVVGVEVDDDEGAGGWCGVMLTVTGFFFGEL